MGDLRSTIKAGKELETTIECSNSLLDDLICQIIKLTICYSEISNKNRVGKFKYKNYTENIGYMKLNDIFNGVTLLRISYKSFLFCRCVLACKYIIETNSDSSFNILLKERKIKANDIRFLEDFIVDMEKRMHDFGVNIRKLEMKNCW